MLIIINNFMLNSAYFLEKENTRESLINISIKEINNRVVIYLENNGPPLDGVFSNNPDRIFDAGVSTKIDEHGNSIGTGIGLWIVKMVVQDNSGEIHPMDKSDGFGLRISLPK